MNGASSTLARSSTRPGAESERRSVHVQWLTGRNLGRAVPGTRVIGGEAWGFDSSASYRNDAYNAPVELFCLISRAAEFNSRVGNRGASTAHNFPS